MSKDRSKQIEQELATIKGNKELLNPADVVAWATKNKTSALHSCFTWDDAEAGKEYRLWEARRLIALHIVTEGGERRTVSLAIDRKKGGGYREIKDVARQPDLRKMMLQEAMAELNRIRHKYEAIKELAAVFGEIDKADRRMNKKTKVAA